MNSIITPTQMRLHEERKQRLAKVRQIAIQRQIEKRQAEEDRKQALKRLQREHAVSRNALWIVRMKRLAGEREIFAMEMISAKPLPYPTMMQIVKEVAEKHGVTVLDLMSNRRFKKITTARQEFCYRARYETPRSLPEIGRFLGGKDHTTILHAVKRHAERIANGDAI